MAGMTRATGGGPRWLGRPMTRAVDHGAGSAGRVGGVFRSHRRLVFGVLIIVAAMAMALGPHSIADALLGMTAGLALPALVVIATSAGATRRREELRMLVDGSRDRPRHGQRIQPRRHGSIHGSRRNQAGSTSNLSRFDTRRQRKHDRGSPARDHVHNNGRTDGRTRRGMPRPQ